MRAVLQRVTSARVSVSGDVIGEISAGLVALIAAGPDDTEADARTLADKITQLRIFGDNEGKMNLSVLDISGEILAISQFTLFGDTRKGRRPSFVKAMEPIGANQLYEQVVTELRKTPVRNVATGRFGADMQVSLVNDGPVTLLIDTKRTF